MKTKCGFKFYILLFLTMLKIGAFTFGGGYAMISLLENEFVGKKHWVEKDEFLDMVAIAESTPGPIAVNSATYIGYKTAGVLGSLIATFGIVIPSFGIIFIISLFFDRFLSLTYVGYAFRGIQVCVIYLIFTAGFKMLRSLKKTPFNIITLVAVSGVMVTLSLLAVNFSSVFYILIAGCAALILYFIAKIRRKGGERE